MTAHAHAALWDYDARTLDLAEARFLELHLADCPDCVEALQVVRQARGAVALARQNLPAPGWAQVDEAVSRRVERALEREARGPFLRPLFVGALAVLAVAGAAALVRPAVDHFTRPAPTVAAPQVVQAPSPVRVEEARGFSVARAGWPLPAFTELAAGDVLTTGPGGTALLRLPDASRVRLSPGAELTLTTATEREVTLDLGRGRVLVRASHVARERFVVRSGGVEVLVVGTVFSVEQRSGGLEVAVLEGQVRVETTERALAVRAGERYRVDGKKSRAKALPMPKALRAELAEVARVGDVLAGGVLAATGGERTTTPPLVQAGVGATRDGRLTDDAAPLVQAGTGAPRDGRVAEQRPLIVPLVMAPAGAPRDGRSPESMPPAGSVAEQRPLVVPLVMAAPGPQRDGRLPRLSSAESRARLGTAPPERDATGESTSRSSTAQRPESGAVTRQSSEATPTDTRETDAAAEPDAEWSAMPRPSPRAQVVAPPPARVESKSLETLFLERATSSMTQGGCERFLRGLEEIALDAVKTPSTEQARVLRARCLATRLLPRQAMNEYRKYLLEYPQGRFADEAHGALGEPSAR